MLLSGKNYKEAARIANEIKDMAASESDQKAELGNLNATLLTESGNETRLESRQGGRESRRRK